jgi:hypothetical protein
MADFIRAIIGLCIGIVVFASLYMSTIKNTALCSGNCTGNVGNPGGANPGVSWSAQEVVLWGLLTIVGIVGLVYAVLNIFGIG